MSSDTGQPGPQDAQQTKVQAEKAIFTTGLALDRTTLAWIRTSLTMASFGLGMVGFFRSLRSAMPSPETIDLHEAAIRFGTILVLLGTSAMAVAALSHWFTLRRLRAGQPLQVERWPLAIVVALLVAILFLSGLWSVLTR